MTAFSIVRFRGKPGRDQEIIDGLRNVLASAPLAEGLRKRTLIKLGATLFCSVLEWDSVEALVNARPRNRIVLDAIRDLLEDRGDVGVTYAASGAVVCDFAQPETEARPRGLGQARAWNILRYHLKHDTKEAAETVARAALPPPGAAPPPGLRRIAVVQIGDRAFCVLGEWDSYDHLSAGGPAVIQRLETFRDCLETVPGGLGVIQATAGIVADERSSSG